VDRRNQAACHNLRFDFRVNLMTRTSTERNFTGPYKSLLTELADLIDWLWSEHDKSFVKAGDDKVYAFGGDGYIVVLDESQWAGLIELITPNGAFTIKPGEDGNTTVTSSNADEKASKQSFKEAIDNIKNYYERRYWSTPKTSHQ
jgi:hypothetical protein